MTATVAGISIQTVGVILIAAGIVGLVLSLLLDFSANRRAPGEIEVVREREPVVRERY